MRWWIHRQKEEREEAEKLQREIEEAYREVILSRDKRAATLAQMEEECRRRLNEATAKFNYALVQKKKYILFSCFLPTHGRGKEEEVKLYL